MRKNSEQLYKNKSRNETKWNDGRVIPSLRCAPFRLLLLMVITILLLTAPLAFAEGNAKPILEGIVKVENDQPTGKSETILTFDHHPTTSMYVVRGLIQHRDIERNPMLEMWNAMPDGNRYFSRQPVRGPWVNKTDGWREFTLPFNLMNHKPESVAIEINVVMPGKGTIELKDLTISDIATLEWFDKRTANTIGAIMGVSAGLYGGLFGCLAGFLVPRGKGRKLVFGMLVFIIVFGGFLLSIGLLALLLGQPFHVWFWFAFAGGLALIIFPPQFFVIKKGFEQFEQRKMQALDM